MGTFILKRKNYNLPSNEVKGENVGENIGRGTGALAGTAVGGTVGAGTGLVTGATIGAKSGLKNAAAGTSKVKSALSKGGKLGLIGAGIGLAGGALLGHNKGKEAGGQLGVNVGGAVGAGVDSATGTRRYSVSNITKGIYKAAKPLTPKSKRIRLARTAVKSDKAVKNTIFEAATNPGSVSSKVINKVAENPVTMMPGGLSVGGSLATAIKKKPSTIDDVLRDTKIGKPLYNATREIGRKVGRISEPIVNSAYQMAKSM